MGYKFSCHKICFQLQLRVTITCHRLGRISPAFTFGEAGLWGSSALLCHRCLHISQMLSQGTAAWVNIGRRGCERRERELGICMYPYSWNWFLESKLEIGSDFLVSLDKKRGASLFASSLLTSQFKSIAWVSSQSVHQEEMVIVSVSPTLRIHAGNSSFFALQMSFESFKSSLWKWVHSLFLCLFPPLKSSCDLGFLSQLCFWLFSAVWGHFYLVHLSSFSSSQGILGRNPFLLVFLHTWRDAAHVSLEF